MSDRWTEVLSDYLDGDLDRTGTVALETHLESCEECRVTLDQLRLVKARARALVDPPASAELWAGISARIVPADSTTRAPLLLPVHTRRRYFSFTMPQLIAAGVTLVAVSAGLVWMLSTRSGQHLATTHPESTTPLTQSATPDPVATLATYDPGQVDAEIAELRVALQAGRGRLQPSTVQVLEKNLKVIEQATAEARKALAADPANVDLRQYLAGSMQRKIDLFKRAAQLAGV